VFVRDRIVNDVDAVLADTHVPVLHVELSVELSSWYSYRVMARPPSLAGAEYVTTILVLNPSAVSDVGAPGVVDGRAATAALATPLPAAETARIEIE
jgi:hypothetical protein